MAAQNTNNTVISGTKTEKTLSLRGGTMTKSAPLVPKLRFNEFDGGWNIETIGRHIKLISGLAFKGEDISEDPSGIPILRGINITEGFIRHNEKIDRYFLGDASKLDRIRVKEGDLVLGMDGSKVGKNSALISKVDADSLLIQRVARLRGKNGSCLSFIYQHINSIRFHKYVDLVNTSSGIPHISSKQINDFKIYFPNSLEEQQKIAAFLSAVDKKIQQLTKKKELLEQYKKGVMQQLFSQKIRFTPSLKDFKGELAQGMVIDLAANYPDWEEKRLGDLTYKVGKKNKENIQYPIYSINNQEGFRPQSEQFDGLDSNDRGYDISLYKIVESETFAYNPARINVGSIGYSYDLNKVIVSSLYVCFKTKDKLEDLYLLAYLDTYTFHKDILRYEEGGVRQYLFYENFSHIKIPLPSNEEQQKIAKFLSAIDTKIEAVKQQIEKTQTFKKGLLQQMFV